jgi:hypothetical protein
VLKNQTDMEIRTKTRTEQILQAMHVLAWVAFIGLLIKTGALLVSYGMSCVNPGASRNFYAGQDLYDLIQFSFLQYTMVVSFMIAISGMKAFATFLLIKALSKVNMMNPFKIEVAHVIERLSYVLFGTWILTVLSNAHADWLGKRTGLIQGDGVDGEFIFMAGLVFILSQVFKRGVEIQSENDLTV